MEKTVEFAIIGGKEKRGRHKPADRLFYKKVISQKEGKAMDENRRDDNLVEEPVPQQDGTQD